MSDVITPAATAEDAPQIDAPPADEPQKGESELGDAGKKALDAMKAERAAARADAKAAIARAEAAEAALANKDRPAEEVALDNARNEGRSEATKAANVRILKSELKALATGKLADPTDAALFIDLSKFEVNDEGDPDSDALTEAIADLLVRKPHLSAGAQQRFQGGGDGGARLPAKPDTSIDEAIAAAEKARNFPLAITLKQQKAAKKG